MKKLISFFIPILWIIAALYILDALFSLINTNSTISNILGVLGILLVIYLSIVTKLGIYIFKQSKQ